MRVFRLLVVQGVEIVLVCLMVALCVDIFVGVFSRYVVGETMPWYDEVARYLFIWMAFIGAAVAVRRHAHFGINTVVARFSPEKQRRFRWIAWGLLATYAIVITIQGIRVMQGVSVQESPALGLSLAWVFLVVPVHGALILAYVIGFVQTEVIGE
jgi:TRAP-type transport system small permease protein